MSPRSGEPKRTVILVADLDGPEVSHVRSEVRRRYDVGFVLRKSNDKVKSSDFQMAGAIVRVAYFSELSLRDLQGTCHRQGPIFGYAFDCDYSSQKAELCVAFPSVRYRKYTRNLENLIAIFGEIAADLRDMSKADAVNSGSANLNFRPLGHRIANAALAISSLRLNATSEVVAELNQIADDLLSTGPNAIANKFDVRYEAKKALSAVASLYDHIDNSHMAKIIVSGAVTAMIADVGWSAVACQTVQLASWHGKDAFIAAVKMLPSFAGMRSKKANQSRLSVEVDE